MTRVRITKIICPSCNGTGQWATFSTSLMRPVACGWCKGEKRLPVHVACRYADDLYTIAVGGYVSGDHDIKDRDRMTGEAMAIFKIIGERPTWLRAI